MWGFSPFHGSFLLIALAVVVYLVSRILQKAGYSGWWTLLALVPLANLIGLWFFAITPWPSNRTSTAGDLF